MTVLWQTYQTPSYSSVEWGTGPGNYAESSGSLSEGEDHQFIYTISGLSPATLVYYRIIVDGIPSEGSFRSAQPPWTDKLAFYAYGDIRGGINLLTDFQYIYHSYVEEEILNDVAQDSQSRQTFVLNTGDFVHCGQDEEFWDQQYFNRTRYDSLSFQASLPVMGAIGNHELYLPGFLQGNAMSCGPLEPGQVPDCSYADMANAGSLFYKYFPYDLYPYPKGPGNYRDYYYYFDYGPARFICLDCFTSSLEKDSPQYLWLERTISPAKLWNIICLHVPLWASSYPVDEVFSRDLRMNLGPLLEEKGVALVLQGHDHFYSRCLVNGITYLTLGGGGAELENATPYDPSSAPYVIKAAKAHHFARFEISGQTMTVTVIGIYGRVLDFFGILPPGTKISPPQGAPSILKPTLTARHF
jgi:hypothetical protein